MMTKLMRSPLLFLVLVLTAGFALGCYNNSPVKFIELIHEPPNSSPTIPPGGWELHVPRIPHPTQIQTKAAPIDGLVAIFIMSDHLNENVTFSKYVFFNKATQKEYEINTPLKMGPYKSKQVVYLGIPDPLTVPSDLGTYEFRIYINKEIVASAIFEVGE
jgi:hypothetical protein